MNTDNLATWPETICLIPRDANRVGLKEIPNYDAGFCWAEWHNRPMRFLDVATIEYVRADVVLKREAKLKAGNSNSGRWSMPKLLMRFFWKRALNKSLKELK